MASERREDESKVSRWLTIVNKEKKEASKPQTAYDADNLTARQRERLKLLESDDDDSKQDKPSKTQQPPTPNQASNKPFA